LISILKSPAGHGDKIDDCVRVVALRPVMLDVDVALPLRQLGSIFVHDEREVGKDLESRLINYIHPYFDHLDRCKSKSFCRKSLSILSFYR
jgi:hypothetical protein